MLEVTQTALSKAKKDWSWVTLFGWSRESSVSEVPCSVFPNMLLLVSWCLFTLLPNLLMIIFLSTSRKWNEERHWCSAMDMVTTLTRNNSLLFFLPSHSNAVLFSSNVNQGGGGVCAQARCHHWQQVILQGGLQTREHKPSQQVSPAV